MTQQRKITFRMYPNASQAAALEVMLALHCRIYNSLLEEHKRRYEAKETTFSFTAMCKELTRWRSYAPSLEGLNAQSMQVTAKRVTKAFAAFFERIKAGDTPGYPRFKPLQRFAGWGYKKHGDGWKMLDPYQTLSRHRHSYRKIRISGVGEIPLRGKGRFEGEPKTAEVMHKNGRWYLSVTFNVGDTAIKRERGTEAGAFDWGLSTLLTLAKNDGTIETIDNPRWLKQKLQAIRTLQRVISAEEQKAKAASGKDSDFPVHDKLKRLYAQLRAVHRKIARQRHDFYHQLTALLVKRFAVLGTEKLDVKNMTASAHGTVEKPGKMVQQKAGLNREILSAAPATLLKMLAYKVVETGTLYGLAPTKKLKPTQRCHCCGRVEKKALSEREHICPCGVRCGRDENAAKTILRWLLEGEFWLVTPGTGETPPITAQAV